VTTTGRDVPARRTIRRLREEASGCRACPLWQRATQTVFGAGPPRAPLILVGEQPGDEEDRQGAPFVGPAGRLLDEALKAAQIERAQTYVTNAVKHFKWKPSEGRGKRRLHERPNANEIRACRPWLLAEIEAVGPKVIVCLGATAARSLLGDDFRVTKQRGEAIALSSGHTAIATIHPSAILRAPDHATREREMDRFIADLTVARALLSARPGRAASPVSPAAALLRSALLR
jgi:uracil-DNA glycosylase family protein